MSEGLSAIDRAFNWVDVWACMARRHGVSLELVLVDWATDTRGGRALLRQVLRLAVGGLGQCPTYEEDIPRAWGCA